VHSLGSRKSAISGIHTVKKLINCDRIYAKGVFNPYRVLFKNVLFVNTYLKKSLICWG